MTRKQIEEDLHGCVEEYTDFEEEVKVTSKCNHDQIRFLYPASGKQDVYECLICRKTLSKLWNETGTTSYKDRV